MEELEQELSKENEIMEIERKKWRGRRRMAWIALLSMIILTFFLFSPKIPDTRITILVEAITWFYFSMASIIGAYMGFTTWASKSK